MKNYDLMLQWIDQDNQELSKDLDLYHQGIEYDRNTVDKLMATKLIVDNGKPYIGMSYPTYYIRTFNPYVNKFVDYCEITRAGYTYLRSDCVEVMTEEEREEYYLLEHWAIMRHSEIETTLPTVHKSYLPDWDYDTKAMIMITIATMLINIILFAVI